MRAVSAGDLLHMVNRWWAHKVGRCLGQDGLREVFLLCCTFADFPPSEERRRNVVL